MSLFESLLSLLPSSASAGATPYPSGGARIWPLSALMREEMKKGVVYSMKVVLRGMRGTGKTTLLSRLSGHPMPTAYVPSAEISATTIRICGRGCQPHEGTRIDIWDVVDEGRPRGGAGTSAGPSLPPLPSGQDTTTLRHQLSLLGATADARSIDVYQGCHMAIFLLDPARPETLDYALREAARAPPQTCLLLALNFADRPLTPPPRSGTPRPVSAVLTMADLAAACRSLRRAATPFVTELLQGRSPPYAYAAPAMWLELSAATGAGVPRLVDALNVPNTLLRAATLEERARGLYAELQVMAQRITDEQGVEGTDRRATHPPVTPPSALQAQGQPQRIQDALPPPPRLSPPLPPPPLSPSLGAAELAGGGGAGELKLAHAPVVRPHARPALYDDHGIELGFFDDPLDAPDAGPSRSSSSSLSSPSLASLARGLGDRPAGSRLAPLSAHTSDARPGAAVTDGSAAVEEAPSTYSVEAKAAAAAEALAEALRGEGGLAEDFFDSSEAAAPAVRRSPSSTSRDGEGAGFGRGGAAAGRAGPLVARPLATQRRPVQRPGSGIGNGRATAPATAPVVAVDVQAMLAAMQATLDAAPVHGEEGEADVSTE